MANHQDLLNRIQNQIKAEEQNRFEILVLDILAWLLCEGVHNQQFKISDIYLYFNELEDSNPDNQGDLDYLTAWISGHFRQS
ncbi:hypothetical protein [Neisseria sp. S1]|uniref:hypothetical protein n=1 Tax=Neisseria sp. S1 TaxID=3318354 RepID=UPI003A882B33